MSTPLLSAKLVELRKQSGYSQQEVADYLGLTREGYSHYERNARDPSLESLVKLCRLYHVDINELINEETILIPTDSPQNMTQGHTMSRGAISGMGGGMAIGTSITGSIALNITSNMQHLLKLFTGKNADIDLTNLSKDDIATLAQYKKLNKKNQKEVQQFIKFKHFISRGEK